MAATKRVEITQEQLTFLTQAYEEGMVSILMLYFGVVDNREQAWTLTLVTRYMYNCTGQQGKNLFKTSPWSKQEDRTTCYSGAGEKFYINHVNM